MKTILLTGSQGFIGSYICNELLKNGYKVVGIDNFSKYGRIVRSHDDHENFIFIEMDAQNLDSWRHMYDRVIIESVDYIISCAALIGGISYFHKYAYDLLATNERILAGTFDLAIDLFKSRQLKRIIVLSSSMVFENTKIFPTPETEVLNCPVPSSVYGFQKLSCEIHAKAAYQQYKLPYTIIRPFNCVGVGEDKSLKKDEVLSGNIKLMMSHVLPDLVNKCLLGQDPLHIFGEGNQIRCYTNGKDIAKGIRLALESEKAINEDFNISTPVATSVLELAQLVWSKINPNKEFRYICDPPFECDVQKRIPDVSKAEKLLNFKAEISLEESVDEVIAYMRNK